MLPDLSSITCTGSTVTISTHYLQSRYSQLPTVHLSQFWVIKLARWLAGQIPDLTTGVSIPCRILGKLSDVGISFSLRDVGTYQQVKATA